MNKGNLLTILLAAASLPVLLAGCSFGGSDSASAAEHVDAGATPVSSLTATPTVVPGSPAAVAPTVTPTVIADAGSVTPLPEPLAYVDALVSASTDSAGFDITVTLDVRRRGVSGVDLVARSTDADVVVESIVAGPLLGTNSLVALASATVDSAHVALARAGESAREDVSGVVSVLRVAARSPEAIRAGLSLSLNFTDAALTLHGPFEAAFDLGDDR
jgi:hypothetical protein